ncbi:unnamed protein product [Brugia timori]|uniref:Ovule protein n=1 Tax=Brugia timori TaxID=42155 RepID=A0A0R3QKX4_9BILA|nr:unnamed protein product [Brugia timori]
MDKKTSYSAINGMKMRTPTKRVSSKQKVLAKRYYSNEENMHIYTSSSNHDGLFQGCDSSSLYRIVYHIILEEELPSLYTMTNCVAHLWISQNV